MPRPCVNPWCEEEIPDSARPETVECRNCLASHYRWRKRTVGDAIRWHRKMKLWDSRLEMRLPDDVDKDVTPGAERRFERAYKELLERMRQARRPKRKKATPTPSNGHRPAPATA